MSACLAGPLEWRIMGFVVQNDPMPTDSDSHLSVQLAILCGVKSHLTYGKPSGVSKVHETFKDGFATAGPQRISMDKQGFEPGLWSPGLSLYPLNPLALIGVSQYSPEK